MLDDSAGSVAKGLKLSSLLEDLPCLEDHQRNSCLPQVICTSAPNSCWSVIITQSLSWEMIERKILWLVQTTVHGDLLQAASPSKARSRPEFSLNPAPSRTLSTQKAHWALKQGNSHLLSYSRHYISPWIIAAALHWVPCTVPNAFKTNYTLLISQPVLHCTDVENRWQPTFWQQRLYICPTPSCLKHTWKSKTE